MHELPVNSCFARTSVSHGPSAAARVAVFTAEILRDRSAEVGRKESSSLLGGSDLGKGTLGFLTNRKLQKAGMIMDQRIALRIETAAKASSFGELFTDLVGAQLLIHQGSPPHPAQLPDQ